MNSPNKTKCETPLYAKLTVNESVTTREIITIFLPFTVSHYPIGIINLLIMKEKF